MVKDFLKAFRHHLKKSRIPYRPGLSAEAMRQAQERCGVEFPPDLCELLTTIVVEDGRFFDWENLPQDQLTYALERPYQGLCYDIRNADLWLEVWGERPAEIEKRVQRFTELYKAKAPLLVPVFGHRYISSQPCQSGNPVYSVWQSDIIFYGTELENYLRNEYHMQAFDNQGDTRDIPFWKDLAR